MEGPMQEQAGRQAYGHTAHLEVGSLTRLFSFKLCTPAKAKGRGEEIQVSGMI